RAARGGGAIGERHIVLLRVCAGAHPRVWAWDRARPARSGGWLRAGDEPLDGLEGAKLLMAAVGSGAGPVAAGVKLNTPIGVDDDSMADAPIPVAATIMLREIYVDPLPPGNSSPNFGRLHAGQLRDTSGEGVEVEDLLHGVLLRRVGVHRRLSMAPS